MRLITSLESFKLANGNYDWTAYRAAQKANGEICTDCGAYTVWGKGHPDRCGDCKRLEEPGETTHHSLIRCPKCGHQMEIGSCELGELYEDGSHDVSCQNCDHDFEVSTQISFSFTSPARIPEEKKP